MTHGSLFSGIGGFELAASWAGIDTLFNCEWNQFARTILNYHFPDATSYTDITKTDFTEWRGKIDILSGGFPCQPFSVAGQRKGSGDDRYLWPEMLRAIREIRPRWVIGENVAGIVSMVQPGEGVEVGSEIYSEKITRLKKSRNNTLLKPSVQTLSERDIPSSRLLFRLVPLERRTGETEYGLLPTVQTQGLKVCENRRSKTMNPELLPTPTSSEAKAGGQIVNGLRKTRKTGITYSSKLIDLAVSNLLPTPTTRDANGIENSPSQQNKGRLAPNVAGGTTSQLNPLFVAEMMGFQTDWTVLPFQSGGRKASKPTETR